MKRTSLVFLFRFAVASMACTAHPALAEPPSLQSRVDVFAGCIEQGILVQLHLEASARNADAVRAQCAAHRAALEPLLGAGAREVVDALATRRMSEAFATGPGSAPGTP